MSVGVSNLADGINVAAVPLLVASLTRDPALVAGVLVAQRLPWFLFSVYTGALADRWDRRKAMISANLTRAVALILVGVLLWGGKLNLPIIYAIFFGLGVVETLFDNAAFAVLPSLVDKNSLSKANGRLFATQTIANELAGPPLGSWLFSLLKPLPIIGSGILYAVSGYLLKTTGTAKAERRSVDSNIWQEMREGFSWYWGNRLIRTLSLLAGTANMVGGAAVAILVLYAQDILGLGDSGYGLLLTAGSIGGVAGGLGAEYVSKSTRAGTLIFVTNLLVSASYVGIGLFPNVATVGCMLAFISFTIMIQNTVIITLRQTVIPDRLLARVTSAYRMIGLAGTPLGALLGGLIAKHYGLETPYLLGGSFLAVVSFLILPRVNNTSIEGAMKLQR